LNQTQVAKEIMRGFLSLNEQEGKFECCRSFDRSGEGVSSMSQIVRQKKVERSDPFTDIVASRGCRTHYTGVYRKGTLWSLVRLRMGGSPKTASVGGNRARSSWT
jgi:hypothetical protein